MDDLALLDAPAPAPDGGAGGSAGSASVTETSSAGSGTGGAPGAGTGGDAAAGATAPAAAESAATGEAAPAAGQAQPAKIEVEYPDDETGPAAEAGEDSPAAEQDPAETGRTEGGPDASPASARFGTSALTKLLKDNAGLAQALEAEPRAKAQLYQMARRSQELAQYQELVPSLARAREAVEAQQALGKIDQAYYAGEPERFWTGLLEASGGSGAYERNVQYLHKVFLDRLEQDALQTGNESLTGAVGAIRESLGWGNSRAPRSRAEDGTATAARGEDLPPHIRQRLEEAERSARELQQLRTRLSEGERQANEKFLDETAQEAGREVRAFVDAILEKTGFSDYDRQNIARDFLEEVSQLADQDKVHNAALEEILRAGGTTPATRARMVARVKAWARQNGRDILEPILQRAGAGLKQRQQQREAARTQARPEPASSGAPASPVRPTARDLVKQAEGRLGRRLSDREILDLG